MRGWSTVTALLSSPAGGNRGSSLPAMHGDHSHAVDGSTGTHLSSTASMRRSLVLHGGREPKGMILLQALMKSISLRIILWGPLAWLLKELLQQQANGRSLVEHWMAVANVTWVTIQCSATREPSFSLWALIFSFFLEVDKALRATSRKEKRMCREKEDITLHSLANSSSFTNRRSNVCGRRKQEM